MSCLRKEKIRNTESSAGENERESDSSKVTTTSLRTIAWMLLIKRRTMMKTMIQNMTTRLKA